MKPVSLRAVVDEMEILTDTLTAYINKKTGELITISDEEVMIIERGDEDNDFIPDWQKEVLPKVKEILDSKDFIPLPDQFDIHEYSIMERFCYSVEEDELEEELLRSIKGSGAFRRFKDTIHQRGIQDDWYRYRDNVLKRIAADFLEAEGIAFVDEDSSENID
jgi:hypothetical protein